MCVCGMGAVQRATGATKLNEVSSRSHAVCIIIVEKCTTVVEGGVGAVWPARAAAANPAGKDGAPASHSVKVGGGGACVCHHLQISSTLLHLTDQQHSACLLHTGHISPLLSRA